MAKKAKKPGIWKEFKDFINRGNAFMLAVGVVIGGAFSAIVTAFVNILLSVATWPVPGGLKGLVTVLPALTDAQKGMDEAIGLGQKFAMGDLQELAEKLANKTYGEAVVLANPNLIESIKATIVSKYTLHGTTFTYNMSAVIDWGALLTAVISFIIIAVVLFIIVKVTNEAARKKEELRAKAQEAYYEKHPEERPVPPEEGKPEPTELDYLKRIAEALDKKKQFDQ